ncbi:L-fucose:H+ symporter permease [Bifidobacterium moukalabense]|uniref:L-fucose:H+ symporter permease n=1 Tax=Bifidobacterium moukalabense TaxID=1333651 RepID=UPI0010F6E3A6|nr:L-fucose:H+ symporter permease [Bifidobacterium moukalabense]
MTRPIDARTIDATNPTDPASEGVQPKKQHWIEFPDGYLDRTPVLQFAMTSVLFAIWAIASSLNDILITQFKAVFSLSDLATAFVQSAFYGGYFLIAIPASLFIKKFSYKLGIIAGLSFFAVGCFIFFPASRMVTYEVFLFAIFVEAIGLSFLETSADTYATLMGPKRLGTVRLNIAQTMNALGLITGILLGKYLVFQDSNLHATMAKMAPAEAKAYGAEQLARTLEPYKYLLIALAVLIVLFAITKFPKCRPTTAANATGTAGENKVKLSETLRYLSHNRRFLKGIGVQFIYIGAQTGIWSFTIRLALNQGGSSMTDRKAADFMIFSYVVFFVGRLLASYLLSRSRETRVLATFMALGCVSLLCVAFLPGMSAVWAAVAVSLFLGPGWPTIYARTLSTVEDRRHTETAGAIIVMALVGGAVLPTLQGALSDAVTMQFSFILPAIELLIVALYFVSEFKRDKYTPQQLAVMAAAAQQEAK